MQNFKIYNKQDVLSLTKIRRFETKIGERIQILDETETYEKAIQQSTASFAMIGIPEDIGIKANHGLGGASTAWIPFLRSFLNTQSNDFFTGDDVLLLGHLDFSDIANLIEANAHNEEERLAAYRHAVNAIDDCVENIIKIIAENGMIPIVIGGGHNNAYGCIKGAAKGLHKDGKIEIAQINVINLDAHSDYRPAEGRHSGNAFRYAEDDGYLEKYCIIGAHENYLPQNVLMDIKENPFIKIISYEDIFLREKMNFTQAIAHSIGFTEDTYCGIEVDLDSIENVLASASTPSGLTVFHARQYISMTATDCKAAYLHICEGASALDDGRKSETTGKLISYLVTDFIKALNS